MVGRNLDAGIPRVHKMLRAIQGLKRGDRVVVLWHDACRVTNDPDVRPEFYSTPKETQGTVYDCVPDPDFPDIFYLIIGGETTGGRADYYDSVPVAWIAKLEKLEVSIRHPRKTLKIAPINVERVIVYDKKMKVQKDSGGVERLPKKWTKFSVPLKFVENVSKVVQ